MSVPDVPREREALVGTVSRTEYNAAEREYSRLLIDRLEQLLRGQRNELVLLRKYHDDPRRLGIMPTPRGLDRRRLRIPVAEQMAWDLMAFLADSDAGGPVTQDVDAEGRVTELREFPTRYPHIVIRRLDLFPDGRPEVAEWTEWRAHRVQNQRTSTLVNRLLDAANLGLEVAKAVRGR